MCFVYYFFHSHFEFCSFLNYAVVQLLQHFCCLILHRDCGIDLLFQSTVSLYNFEEYLILGVLLVVDLQVSDIE